MRQLIDFIGIIYIMVVVKMTQVFNFALVLKFLLLWYWESSKTRKLNSDASL